MESLTFGRRLVVQPGVFVLEEPLTPEAMPGKPRPLPVTPPS